MDGNHPKRRKDKYNPYTIGTTGDGRHWLTFSDGQGNRHHFEISAAVFALFDSFELDDLSYLNEVDRHYEQSELMEASLYDRAVHRPATVEESALQSMEYALTPEQLQRVLDFTDRTDIYDLYVMHCAIQLAFACCMRGGEVGGTQWERFSRSDQVLYIDRVIDRVDKKLIEKLPKMDILFRFPNLYPGTRTVIVLKQPKTEGSIRTVYIPETVAKKLEKLREMQMKLKLELGDDGYMDYGLIICQANGRPIMTEHLNKRFKEVLIGLNDPTINVDNVVFHSLRHTSTGVKLRLSKGDLKAVQGDGGWNSPDMVTKRYAHILDEDRRRLADEMEQSFYKGKAEEAPVAAAPALDAEALASLLASNPELLKKALESVQLANNT
jgi:integrase